MVVLLSIIVLTISLALELASAEGGEANSFDISYLYPLVGALVIAGLMWKFLSRFSYLICR